MGCPILGNEVLEVNTCYLTHSHVAIIVHNNLQQPHKMLRCVLKLQYNHKESNKILTFNSKIKQEMINYSILNLIESLLGVFAFVRIGAKSSLKDNSEAREVHIFVMIMELIKG